jgi:hypothetical protein
MTWNDPNVLCRKIVYNAEIRFGFIDFIKKRTSTLSDDKKLIFTENLINCQIVGRKKS